MLNSRTRRLACVLAILAAAIFLRAWKLDLPFVEPYNSIARQSISASVARNFYQNGFNFFYPEINENGRGPYLFNAEMPFYTYAMALGYRLAGGVHEGVARSVSVVFSIGTLLFLYGLGRRFAGGSGAVVALAIAAFSPLNVALSRSVQPEATFLFATAGAVYFFDRHLRTNRLAYFWISSGLLFLAVASKFFNAYALVPIVFLAWQKRGTAIFRDPKNYAYVLVACLSFLWTWQMWRLGQTLDLAYYPYRYIAHRAGSPGDVAETFDYATRLGNALKVCVGHLLLPAGAAFAAAGLALSARPTAEERRDRAFLAVWLGTVLLTLIVGWKTVIQHSYYQIPLLLPAALLAGRGWNVLATRQEAAFRRLRHPVVVAALVLTSAAAAVYLYRGLYDIPPRRWAIVQAGKAADRLLPRDALVVASHETSPIQLYYANRRGWSFNLIGVDSAELIRELERRRAQGAGYFLATSLEDVRRAAAFEAHLRAHYRVVEETPEWLLVDLRAARE